MTYKKKSTSEQLTELYSKIETNGRVLPKDELMERFVLGCLMLNEFCANTVFEILGLPEGDEIPFYEHRHRLIFEIAAKIFLKKDFPNMLSIWSYIASHELKEEIPAEYLTELLNFPVATSYLSQECKRLLDLHNRRKYILKSELLLLRGYENDQTLSEILDEAESQILEIRTDRKTKEPIKIEFIKFDDPVQFDVGYKTGLDGLDELLHHGMGAQAGDYIIIAARPSVGKSSLAVNFAGFESMQTNATLFISLEMTDVQIAGKFFEYVSGCPVWKLNPKYEDKEAHPLAAMTFDELGGKAEYIKNKEFLQCFVDDSTSHNPLSIRTQVSRWKKKHNIKAVFIDYLQLISPITNYNNSREREVAEISKSLKAMAKDFQLPFFVLGQLNRTSLARADKRPSLGDLRESGSLEQDADMVIFLHDEIMSMSGNPEKERDVELIVAKNRLGACGSVFTKFFTEISTFKEIAKEEALRNIDARMKEQAEYDKKNKTQPAIA